MKKENMIKVLVVEPCRKPYIKRIENSLRSLQAEVGGYIEVCTPFADPVAIILDEEGKNTGKPFNRALRDDEGCIYDLMVGTFLLAELSGEEFCSLSEEYIDKYAEYYAKPEVLRQGPRGRYAISSLYGE